MNYLKNKGIGYQRGFTLVEILIVISIIAVMATFAITKLNPLRNKGRDTSIRVSMLSIANTAEVNREIMGNYKYMCDSNNKLISVTPTTLTEPSQVSAADRIVEISKKITEQGVTPTCRITTDTATTVAGDNYAVSVPLLFNKGRHFCVDSNGFSGELGSELADGVTACTP
ncbi:MAG: prepilin-type N-terminal cleavage/methylation domain-containing protein [Candidatus Staskawiczbacteria bacterium]|nr:prepilin-type N-terminal cleavage/methylation domain-containing protein [Candidatus Staskawiczbacteria bacterium]